MFDEIAKMFEKISRRTDMASTALKKVGNKDAQEAIESVQKQLPIMSTNVDLKPMFDTPDEAIEASKDQDLILMESFKKNLMKYIKEGV